MSYNYEGGSYNRNGSQFVLIVVLFILLIIVGASFLGN
ncbi:YjcZ family sporulation protein [Ureibacillus sp. GCM10028918]